MFTHQDIWKAIDRLATAFGYSPSGLARKAGLDPTTFNKSKRFSADDKPRWPSTESIAKILNVTGVTASEFTSFIDDAGVSPGEMVALRTREGTVLSGILQSRTRDDVSIRGTEPPHRERTFALRDLDWLARITWSSKGL